MRKRNLAAAAVLLLAGCATTQKVDMKEPRRVVGTDSDVRLDASIVSETLSASQRILLQYDITNRRDSTIAVADIVPEVVYDPETRMVTIGIGSEVPGQQLLPRLITIAPGETKSFSRSAQVNINLPTAGATPFQRFPNALRLRLNFLRDPQPFTELIGISQNAVHDPKLADELFPKWVEQNETVYTNTLPMRWVGIIPPEEQPSAMPAARGRRRGGM